MPTRLVYVAPNGDQWVVKRRKGDEPSSTHRRKAEAEKQARELAKIEEAELVIHGRDGRIQRRDSHGGDPHPPRG